MDCTDWPVNEFEDISFNVSKNNNKKKFLGVVQNKKKKKVFIFCHDLHEARLVVFFGCHFINHVYLMYKSHAMRMDTSGSSPDTQTGKFNKFILQLLFLQIKMFSTICIMSFFSIPRTSVIGMQRHFTQSGL